MKENHLTKNEHLERLSNRSKIIAGLILTGFIVFAIVIGNNIIKINSLDDKINDFDTIIKASNTEIESLEKQIYSLTNSPTDKIKPRAVSNILPVGIMENGKRIFDFTVWIDLSSYTGKSLSSVSYSAIGNDLAFEDRTAVTKRNGFSITFRGTKCVPKIKINIMFTDNSTQTIEFKMCEDLT